MHKGGQEKPAEPLHLDFNETRDKSFPTFLCINLKYAELRVAKREGFVASGMLTL